MKAGDLVAIREGGDRLIYDYKDADGTDFAHIEREEVKFEPTPLLSIIARGYWKEPTSGE